MVIFFTYAVLIIECEKQLEPSEDRKMKREN